MPNAPVTVRDVADATVGVATTTSSTDVCGIGMVTGDELIADILAVVDACVPAGACKACDALVEGKANPDAEGTSDND